MKWISIEDKLPPNSETVWAYDESQGVVEAYYIHLFDSWFTKWSNPLPFVTHWQLFVKKPEAPE